MKKYLIALIPFIVCSILSLIYRNMEPKDFPDPTYPYRNPGVLYYLSSRWFMIGIVLSILFFIFISMEDISNFIEKKIWNRRINKIKKT
jgi:hypothetical protein